MITRIWRGWTTPEQADAYRDIVLGQVIPAIEARRIDGFLHIDVLRALPATGAGTDIEFMTIMHFRDIEAVRAFAGEDWTHSHVPAAARQVLLRYDERAAHFEVLDRRPQGPERSTGS